jgi:hypothetical protein
MSSIIACVRAASGHGGFIKRDKKTGLWWEVGKWANILLLSWVCFCGCSFCHVNKSF